MEKGLLRLACLVVACLTVSALRTGVAPTYIPSTRQKTSYETSPLDWLLDSFDVMNMYTAEQSAIRSGIMSAQDRLVIETANNAGLTTQMDDTFAELLAEHKDKQLQDDLQRDQMMINQGLELQNMMLTAKKTTQDMYMSLTNQTNWGLDAHRLVTKAENEALQLEKQNVLLSLEENLRDEWFNHENAIAVEAQRPYEQHMEASYTHQTFWLDSYNSDMDTRNTGLANQVVGLTTERDTHEAEKIDNIIARADMQLQASNLEHHVHQLESTVRALQFMVTRYEAQNTDMTTYKTTLEAEIATLTTARNEHRTKYVDNVNKRNAAQIRADYNQKSLRDMRKVRDDSREARDANLLEEDGHHQDKTVCETERTTLRATKATLEATNLDYRTRCNEDGFW